MCKKNIVIYGITGSIGDSALKVIKAFPECFRLTACSAGKNIEKLNKILSDFPDIKKVCVAEDKDVEGVNTASAEVFSGEEGLRELLEPAPDTALVALPGKQGWKLVVNAIEKRIPVALANKEALVIAGTLMGRDVTTDRSRIVPVDSEHAALIQLLENTTSSDRISSVYLTASGGAFRKMKKEDILSASPSDALNHPVWNMGEKVTVDSATMVNKGLELMEAYWLFPVKPEQLDVIVHPQVAAHAVVEYIDGSSVAQLAASDMIIPVATGLSYPTMLPVADRLPEAAYSYYGERHDFFSPDYDKYPLLKLAKELLVNRDYSGMVAFAIADEVAVCNFLDGKCTVGDIYRVVGQSVNHFSNSSSPEKVEDMEVFIKDIENFTEKIL